MGFTNTNRINNVRMEKLIEIDFLDIFFHMGAFAILLIVFSVYIFVCETL